MLHLPFRSQIIKNSSLQPTSNFDTVYIYLAMHRSKFESDDEVALLASVLLDQSEGLPAFVAESVKYKGGSHCSCDKLLHSHQPIPDHLFDSLAFEKANGCISKVQVSEMGMPK